MTEPYIMPLGFIDRSTGEGTIFQLTNAEDSKELKPGTPVTVWRYLPEYLALAKLRGTITAVGYTTATFITSESVKDSRWPEEQHILVPTAPVFKAIEESFDPDPERRVPPEKAHAFRRYARRYAELTNPPFHTP